MTQFILQKPVTEEELAVEYTEADFWGEFTKQTVLRNNDLERRLETLEKRSTDLSRWGRFKIFSPAVLTALWFFVGGLFIGAIVPNRSDTPTLKDEPDYAACIGTYTYNNPIKDNRYQELVNALYGCGVYDQGNQ